MGETLDLVTQPEKWLLLLILAGGSVPNPARDSRFVS